MGLMKQFSFGSEDGRKVTVFAEDGLVELSIGTLRTLLAEAGYEPR